MKACVYLCVVVSWILLIGNLHSQDHPFSVKDDIEMVRFSDPSAEASDPSKANAKPSPDGKHVAVVTTRGLLPSDQIESTISIFDLSQVGDFLNDPSQQPPNPRVVATIVSFPHREQTVPYAPVIKEVRWSPDSAHIYFRGESSIGSYQLYEANPNGTGLRTLTPESVSVDQFDVANDALVYRGFPADREKASPHGFLNADARDVTGERLTDILFPDELASTKPVTLTISVVRTGAAPNLRAVPGYAVEDIPMLLHFFPFRLSPSGHQLIAITPVANVPESWKDYEPAVTFEHRRLNAGDPSVTSPNNVLRPRQYSLIDLTTGKAVPLVQAPNAQNLGYYSDINQVVWAPDESRVLLTNVFLPIAGTAGVNSPKNTEPCAVASVDLPSLVPRCLLFETKDPFQSPRIYDAKFGRNTNEVLVFARRGSEERFVRTYELRDGMCHLTSENPVTELDAADGIQIFIKQSLNDPPTLWASDRRTGKARELWDPNSQLSQMSFGEASIYAWKDAAGRDWTAGLVKPVGYVAGKRYPLVIQMYQFNENQFLSDGTDPTAFAARHLADAGFVVLQIRKKPTTLSQTDADVHLEGYRSAIDSLSQAGLIDRSKVGVVGFSWTCWYVVNALIKTPQLFAAATIADGLDNSYMQYLLFGPGPPDIHEQMDAIRGASPFGNGLKTWVDTAPGFHLDGVRTPVRIEGINPASVLQEWELYASLYMQHKPVDFIYFPHGTHIHQKPLERLESQQGSVDWFRFWLQGYEDPDPSKQSQYVRWRRLRSDLQPRESIVVDR